MFFSHHLIIIFTISSVITSCSESQKNDNFMQRLVGKVTALFKKSADRVVEGDLFRVPIGIYKESDVDASKYELKTGEQEPSMRVWATSKDYKDTLIIHLSEDERKDKEGSCNWSDHGHPRLEKFPWSLPLNLFVDNNGELKKEGDTVTMFHNNKKTNERIKIILTLRQGNYRYKWCGGGKFDECIRASNDYESVVEPYLKSWKKKPLMTSSPSSLPLYAYDNQYRLFMGL